MKAYKVKAYKFFSTNKAKNGKTAQIEFAESHKADEPCVIVLIYDSNGPIKSGKLQEIKRQIANWKKPEPGQVAHFVLQIKNEFGRPIPDLPITFQARFASPILKQIQALDYQCIVSFLA